MFGGGFVFNGAPNPAAPTGNEPVGAKRKNDNESPGAKKLRGILKPVDEWLNFLQQEFPNVERDILKRRLGAVNTIQDFGSLILSLSRRGDPEDLALFPEAQSELVPPICKRFLRLYEVYPRIHPDNLKSLAETDKTWFQIAELIPKQRTRLDQLKQIYSDKIGLLNESEFDLEAFLEIFPDPAGHFKNPARQVGLAYKLDAAFDYISLRYVKGKSKEMRKALKENKIRLYQTAKQLDRVYNDIRQPLKLSYWRPRTQLNAALFYEVVFLEYEDEITRHLEEQEVTRKNAFNDAKSKNELQECDYCFEQEFLQDDMMSCSRGHKVCKACLQKRVEVLVAHDTSSVSCFNPYCDAKFSLETLRKVSTHLVFTRLVRLRQVEELKLHVTVSFELYVCPFCSYSMIISDDEVRFQCPYPFCLIQSCKTCKEQVAGYHRHG